MRGLLTCMPLLMVACTLPNPAFESGDGVADETRGKDSGTLEGTSVNESGDAEASSSSMGESSSVGESSMGESSSDAESSSSSTGNDGSSSSGTEGSSSSTGNDGSSSSGTEEGSSSSSTTNGDSTSTDGVDTLNECAFVPTGNDCLNCAVSNADCCPNDCFDPEGGCGCLILCQLQDTDCGSCPVVPLIDQLTANNTVVCLANACDPFCL